MSLFFDYRLSLGDDEAVAAAWSNSEYQSTLAVGTRSGRIIMFQEEGEPIHDVRITRQAVPNLLEWHPYLPVLFVCWNDGVISYWNDDDRVMKEDKSVHGCRVCGLAISPDGTRMVTGDEHGVVGVWSTSRGLTPICQYNKEGAINHLTYCALASDGREAPTIDKMNTFFFFGGSSGLLYLADDLKRCSEVCRVGGQIKALLYYKEDNSIVIITSTLLLVQFRVSPNEKLTPTRKVKLTAAGNTEQLTTIWAGAGLLATVSGESMIRLWNLDQDKNYFLTLSDADMTGKLLRDKTVCIAYHEKKRILAVGTQEGRVVMWKSKFLLSGEAPGSNEGWEPQLPVTLSEAPISKVSWAQSEGLIYSLSSSSMSILTEAMLNKKVKSGILALQISNNLVEIRRLERYDTPMQLQTNCRIKGLDVTSTNLIVWNGKQVETHTLPDSGSDIAALFKRKTYQSAAHGESVVTVNEGQIEICNFQGAVKQTLTMSESEGEISAVNILGDHMVVTTETHIKVYDTSRREFRLIGMPRKFEDKQGQSLGLIRAAFVNSQGNKIALLVDQAPKPTLIFPDTNIYVYDLDIDNFLYYDFGPNQIPVDAAWDTEDPRLLLVETEGLSLTYEEDAENKPEEHLNEAVTLFVASDLGILKQDAVKLENGLCAILGISVPYIYFVGKDVGKDNLSGIGKAIRKTMRDFTGLENCEENVRKAILNFSYYLTAGNMDEAFKAVKTIQNVSVWEKMCQMSVKTKRLDVAEVCLGNMRFARGARAVRVSKKDTEPEAQLAMVAIQLNMLDDAQKLYKESVRHDLLGEMQQASGSWEEAIKTSEAHDRINLHSTYYRYARHFETLNDYSNAVDNYELAQANREEVPRMLHSNLRFQDLERYIINKKDPKLFSWFAQLKESKGDIQDALTYYEKAEDLGSMIRVLTVLGQVDRARQICLDSDSQIANFLFAKYLEGQGEWKQAILFYSRSSRYYPAVKLAKEQKMDGEVMTLSLQSGSPALLLQSAKYFEDKHLLDKAAVLYHKGKNVSKALELCFATHNYDYLRTLVDDLGEGEDPETLVKAAEYFLAQGMYEKAVHLMLSSKQYSQALELCLKNNVKVTDNMIEKMIPDGVALDASKKDLIRRLADLCKKQGSFQLACKLYTKVGEKMKGFKCLLRLGDVEKITYYAKMAKNAQIFVMAANYLQNTNWHNDPELMKQIIMFYTKAKSYDALAGFFDNCASLEIDEFRDYDKALIAVKESIKYITKSSSANKQQLFNQYQARAEIIEAFIKAKAIRKSNSEEMLNTCVQILDYPNVDHFLRVGDVFAEIIEYYYTTQNYQQAYAYINRMRERRIMISPYLDQEIVDTVYQRLGLESDSQIEEEVDEF